MASPDNTTTAAAQIVPEENITIDAATVTTATMAPVAATATATTAATTASANDAEASSSQAAADLAATFPLPSLAATEGTIDASATIVTEAGAATATANVPLTEEEENLAERSRYWLLSGVTEDHLTELVEGGFLPPKAECTWRAPGDEAEPAPQGDEG